MVPATVPLELRGVRPSGNAALPAVALVGRRDQAQGRVLSLQIGPGDAHALLHELQGQNTPRAQAVCLASRLVAALGGRITAARLVPEGTGALTALIEVETSTGSVAVPASPGEALAAAVRLGVPLLGEGSLLAEDAPSEPMLGEAVVAFLEGLDLQGLREPTS